MFFDNLETEVIKIPKERRRLIALLEKISGRLKKVFSHGPKGVIAGIKTRMRIRDFRNNNFSDKKKTILITDPLWELDFLKKT